MGTWYSDLASVVGNADAKPYTNNVVYKTLALPELDIGDLQYKCYHSYIDACQLMFAPQRAGC